MNGSLKKLVIVCISLLVIGGNLRWSLLAGKLSSPFLDGVAPNNALEQDGANQNGIHHAPPSKQQQHPLFPVIDIISIGSLTRPDYQKAQLATFGNHPNVRNFFQITEHHDIETNCNEQLTWLDVQNISGFCGGKRTNIANKHRLLYQLRTKFAKVQWLERTKRNPVAWLCAQKRPIAGFQVALQSYGYSNNNNNNNKQELPDFLMVMDDDTYYNMDPVIQGLVSIQNEQYQIHNDDSIVVAGCVIRSRIQQFKWYFPFGGWGTIFSRGALEALVQPLYCSDTGETTTAAATDTATSKNSWNAKFCPKLFKDRIGEYQVYQQGMSLADIMYAYATKESYVDQAHWSLGFCLHSDWAWGYIVNYYNISIALGRRSNEIMVDRLGAYNGSELSPYYSERSLILRRQCDFDSDQNCTATAHMCHYITPKHMYHLHALQQQQQQQYHPD